MAEKTSRRQFAGQSAQALGLLAWAGARTAKANHLADEPKVAQGANSVASMSEKAVAFLRSRQDAKGGWSTQREPGVTALVVTALLRTGQVAPGDPAIAKAL